ncbi:MAG: hypothetical protein ACREVI_04820 [Steroidobacteraceae bacterium]
MSDHARAGIYRVVERNGPGGRLVLRSAAGRGASSVIVAGYRGAELPAAVTDPEIAGIIDGRNAAGHWRLTSREGSFDFKARAVDRVEEQPALYDALHRRFALTFKDRLAAQALLVALRLPGGARLLRGWHARRGT